MLLIILGFMLIVAGASQRWEPAKLLNRPTEKRAQESDEAQWVKQTYASNMMRAGVLLSACGATINLVSL